MVDTNHKMILANGRFNGTSRAQLRAAFDAFGSSDLKNTLVIHFHGGLVGVDAAEEMAERLLPVYQAAGGYPLFVIWQSQFWETLRNNWQEIAQENAFSVLVERTVQFLLGKLNQAPGEKGGDVTLPARITVKDEIEKKEAEGGEPFEERNAETEKLDEELTATERAQFESVLKNDARLKDAAVQLGRTDAPTLNPELDAELEQARVTTDTGEKALISSTALVAAGVRIILRALKRFSKGRDHGLYTTVVEEVVRELKGGLAGGLLWKLMKKDTADSFEDPEDLFGGTALLKEIGRAWKAGNKPRIILVGHSAGSVYICNLLKKAAAILPEEVGFEVVFLAPACTFKLLDSTLEVAGSRIKSFRSYGMKDDNERQDSIFPPLYLYSLLYFVSGLLEDEVDYPLVGMERYSSAASKFNKAAAPEIERVLQKLADFQSPWVWADSSDGPGLGSLSHRHGDFDNDEETLKSVGHLIGRRMA